MLGKLFRSDFNDYKIVETAKFNVCGEKIGSKYHIEFARYTFGFKRYIKFYHKRFNGLDDVITPIIRDYKIDIVSEYTKFIKKLPVKKVKTYHTPEELCK